MQISWKILLTKTIIWLASEILLNSIGLDTLADYSEFVFDKNTVFSQNAQSCNNATSIFLSASL